MNFGKKLKELRLQKAVTQEQFAAYLNLSPQAVSKWENNITLPDIHERALELQPQPRQ